MGVLDFLGTKDDAVINSIDIETVSTTASVAGGTAATAATGGAAVVLPLAGKILLEESVKDYMKAVTKEKAYQPLKEIADLHDQQEASRLGLGKACAGVCKLLDPLFTEDEIDITELAYNDPEQLDKLIEQKFSGDGPTHDQLRELEAQFTAIFLDEDPPEGFESDFDPQDKEALKEKLKDLFDTNDEREAIQLFMLYEQFLADLTQEFTQSSDNRDLPEEQERALNQLQETVGSMQECWKSYIRLSVENQQFEQLTFGDFERKKTFREASKSPMRAWITGYDFAELVETTPNGEKYYFNRPLPDDHKLFRDTKEAETISEALVERIYNDDHGQNVVLLGEPGMGKSHLCRLAATEWLDRGYGGVLYRRSDKQGEFDEDAQLKQAIRESQEIRGGHVLVVVEDAPQSEGRLIFDVLDEFRKDSVDVTFLLDARTSEWEGYKSGIKTGESHEILGDHSSYLLEYEVPAITKSDCENAIEVFNRTTAGEYYPPAERLYAEVYATETNLGEVLVLTDTLVRNSSFKRGVNLPVTRKATEAHKEIWQNIDLDDPADRLYYEVLLISLLLTGAEIGVYPSLLYALGEDMDDLTYIEHLINGNSEMSRRRGDDNPVPNEVNETSIFGQHKDSPQFRSRHPTWATSFLGCPSIDSSIQYSDLRKIIVDIIKKITELADRPQKRQAIKQKLDNETAFIDRFDEQPGETTARILRSIYKYGARQAEIVPLLDAPKSSGFGTDSSVFEDGIAAEAIPQANQNRLKFELLLIYAEAIGNHDYEAINFTSELDFLQEIETRARETLENPSRLFVVAETKRQLGRTTAEIEGVEWAVVEEQYKEAINAYRSLGETESVARTQRQLAWAAAEAYGVDWKTVKEHHQGAIKTYKDELHDLEGVAVTQRQLAEVAARSQVVGWSEVKTYHEEAVATFNDIDQQKDPALATQWFAREAAATSNGQSAAEQIESLLSHSVVAKSVAELVWLTEKISALRGYETSIETVNHNTYSQLVSICLDILRRLRVSQPESSKEITESFGSEQRSELWNECLLLIKQTLIHESDIDGRKFISGLSDQTCLRLTTFCLRIVHENNQMGTTKLSYSDSKQTAVGILAIIDLYRPVIARDAITQYQRPTDRLIADLLFQSVADGCLNSTDEYVDKQLEANDEFLQKIGIESNEALLGGSNMWGPFLKTIIIVVDADPVILSLTKIDDDLEPLLTGGSASNRMTGMALYGLLRWTSDSTRLSIDDTPNMEISNEYELTRPVAPPLCTIHCPDTMPIEPLLWRFTLGLNPAVPADRSEKYKYAQVGDIPEIIQKHTHTGISGLYEGRSTVDREQITDQIIESLPNQPEESLWDCISTGIGRDLTQNQWDNVVASLPDAERISESNEGAVFTIVSVIKDSYSRSATSAEKWFAGLYLNDIKEILTAESASVRDLLILPFQDSQFSESKQDKLIKDISSHLDGEPLIAFRAASVLYRITSETGHELNPQRRNQVVETLEPLLTDFELLGHRLVDSRRHPNALWIFVSFQNNSSAQFRSIFPHIRREIGSGLQPDRLGYFFRDILYMYEQDRESQQSSPLLDPKTIDDSVSTVISDNSLSIEQKSEFLKPMLEIHPAESPLIKKIVYPNFGQFLNKSYEQINMDHWPEIPDLVFCANQVSNDVQATLSTEELSLLGLSAAAKRQQYATQTLISAFETALREDVIDYLNANQPEALAEIRTKLLDILGDKHSFESSKSTAGEMLQKLPRHDSER